MAIAVATGSASAINGPLPGHQGDQSATQGNGIGQVAGAAAQSKQILPTNVNVAPSLFSVGSNDGWVTQGNASSANANAQNDNQSFQGNGAAQQSGGSPSPWGGSGPSGSTSGKTGWPSGYWSSRRAARTATLSALSPLRARTQVDPIRARRRATASARRPARLRRALRLRPPTSTSHRRSSASAPTTVAVTQGNASSANANARNDNQSVQGNGAAQQGEGNPGPQGNRRTSGQPWAPRARTSGQPRSGWAVPETRRRVTASARWPAPRRRALSCPANVNVAPSLLSVGSGDGGVSAGQRLERQRQRRERRPVAPGRWRGPAE